MKQTKTNFEFRMGCREICFKYRVKKINPKVRGMYESGHKLCSFCENFLTWNGNRCPCCGTLLRSKPRSSNSRKKFTKTLIPKISTKN